MAVLLDKTMFHRETTGALRVAPGRQLYVLQTNGSLNRTVDLATETLVEGFTDEALSVSAGTGPFSANGDGQFSVWFPPGSYDLYAPTDETNPVTRWQPIAAGVAAHDADALAHPALRERQRLNALGFDGVDRKGVSDSAAGLSAAITAAAGRELVVPYGTYRSLSGLTIPTAGLTLILDDAELDFSDIAVAGVALTAAGSLGSSVAVNAVAEGATAITGAAGIETGLAPGDVLKLKSADVFDPGRSGSTHGEQVVVLSTASGQINLRSPVMGTYSTTVTFAKVTQSKLTIKGNGRITCGGSASDHIGLKASWIRALRLDGPRIEFRGCELIAVQMFDCVDFEIAHVDIEGSNDSGMGYGVSTVNACQFGRVHHSHLRDCRHATSTNNTAAGGIPRHITFEHLEVRDTPSLGDAMDCHAAAEYITIAHNDIYDSGYVGINVECNKADVLYNRIFRPAHNGILLLACASGAPEYRAIGNTIYDSPEFGLQFDVLAAAGVTTPLVLDIFDNEMVRCAKGAVWCDPFDGGIRLLGARVNRNRAYACGASGSRIFYVNDADASECCDNITVETPVACSGTLVQDFTRGRWAGNITSYVAAGGTGRAHWGIAVLDSDVSGNIARNATGTGCRGLELSSASANCTITSNGLRGATTPLLLNGVTSHIVTTADAGGAYNKVA